MTIDEGVTIKGGAPRCTDSATRPDGIGGTGLEVAGNGTTVEIVKAVSIKGGDSNDSKLYSGNGMRVVEYGKVKISVSEGVDICRGDSVNNDQQVYDMEVNSGEVLYAGADIANKVRASSATLNAYDGADAWKFYFGNNNTLPKPPERTGYTFGGWYTDSAFATQVTTASGGVTYYAKWIAAEQFPGLTPGGTYWFDLSGAEIPGTVNDSLPDKSLTWVPFTYAGTVDAYVLNNNSSGVDTASQTASQATANSTETEKQYGYAYPHSLFIADYNVTYSVRWVDLDGKGMIFGKNNYSIGGVDYTLRAPSVGSETNRDGSSTLGGPLNNEWELILNKDDGYIKNCDRGYYSWGQDTKYDRDPVFSNPAMRAVRGSAYYDKGARKITFVDKTEVNTRAGFRPVLEIPNGATLKTVTVNLNGGSIGSTTGEIKLAVSSAGFKAPSSTGLTPPASKVFGGWTDSNSNTYAAGAEVPATVTTLTAQWLSTVAEITKVEVNDAAGAYDSTTKMFTVTVPYGTDLTSIAPDIEVSTGASYTPKEAQDFSNGAVEYTVTAEDGKTTKEYYIKVVTAAAPSGGGGGGGGGGSSSSSSSSSSDKPKAPNWTDVKTESNKAENVVVDMNGATEVPSDVFENIAGTDTKIEFNMGNGVSWVVNGMDIPKNVDFSSLNLGISMNTSGISVDVLNLVTGEKGTIQITLSHNGPFGFELTLKAPLGKENAGYWANLYHFNEQTNSLDYETSGRIDADGSAALRMTHASQYAIVIDDKSHAPADFSDVNEGDWYYDAVQYVCQNGLMNGTGNGLFSPKGTTSRAMIMTILARLDGVDTTGGATWYEKGMAWAVQNGVSDGSNPGGSITREQLATMLYRYARKQGEDVSASADLSGYTDASQVSDWALDALRWAVSEGIITGNGNGCLNPGGNATRAETAAMLQRYLELKNR